MLKPIKSNNSPGHSHNGHTSVVGLSFDSCPGNISKEDNKMKIKFDDRTKKTRTIGQCYINSISGPKVLRAIEDQDHMSRSYTDSKYNCYTYGDGKAYYWSNATNEELAIINKKEDK